MAYLISFIRILLGSLMLAAVAINFANVVGRYAFAQPIFWAEEAMVFIQVWCVLIGAALVTHANTHLRMDAVAALAPRSVSRWLDALNTALIVSVSVLVTYVSLKIVVGLIENDQRSVALEIPMAIPYAAVPLGFSAIALMALLRLARLLRTGDPAPTADISKSRELKWGRCSGRFPSPCLSRGCRFSSSSSSLRSSPPW